MKSKKIPIKRAPSTYVHLCQDEKELRKNVSLEHSWAELEFDQIPQGLSPVGITISNTNPDTVHIYMILDLPRRIRKETIAHEALHATNCILRWRICGSMERHRILIICNQHRVKDLLPGLVVNIQGIDEEDQALLVGEISYAIDEALRDQVYQALQVEREGHGEETTEA